MGDQIRDLQTAIRDHGQDVVAVVLLCPGKQSGRMNRALGLMAPHGHQFFEVEFHEIDLDLPVPDRTQQDDAAADPAKFEDPGQDIGVA